MKEILIKLIDQMPAIVTALGIIITAYFSYRSNQQSKVNATKITEVHDSVNGKMEKLLEVATVAARAEGKLQEQGEQSARDHLVLPEIVKVALVEEEI